MTDLSIGDTVIYSTWGGDRRMVRVVGFGHKNGQRVFSGVLVQRTLHLGIGEGVWGYFSQIERFCIERKKG